MAKTSLNLDRQADARIFSFGTTAAGGDAAITINKGTAALSTVVLNVLGSQSIAGDLNLTGNLNIVGKITEQSVTNLAVSNIDITLNKGGTTVGAVGAGIFIEGDSATTIGKFIYDGTLSSKWKVGDGTTQVEVVTVSGTQTLTNKSISGSQITSAVANATLAATVTTNANLSGVITSVGNVTSINSQTGTGSVFVMNTSPTLVTPNIGVATSTSLASASFQSVGTAGSVNGDIIWNNATNAFTQTFRGSAGAASIVYILPTTAPIAGQVLQSSAPSAGISTLSWASAAVGSVTSVSVVTANGVSGTVATASSTPAITLVLGAITPTSVAATGAITGSNLSGTNTGDQVLPIAASPSAVVGLTAISGVANSFMRSDAAPALSQSIAPTWTGLHTHLFAGIASTSTDAVIYTNTASASVGVQQFSPRTRFVGQGWKTAVTAGSQQVEWYMENRPVQGTNNPSSNFAFASIINGATAIDAFTLSSLGTAIFSGNLSAANLSGTNTGDQTSVSGNSGSTTLTAITDDVTTNGTEYITWVGAISGNQAQKTSSTKLTFNPSTGILSSTIFSGSGSGLTGTASSLTAGTVTTNANLTGGVTSVGNVTTVITNANLSGDVTSTGNVTVLVKYQRKATVSGTQDGTNKIFTLSSAFKTGSDQIYLNGTLLDPGATNDYVYDGNVTITFQAAFTAPVSTDKVNAYGVF